MKDRIITQAIAIAFFVIAPILVTLLAPLTKLQFQHSQSGAAVTVVRYTLIFIPWRTERIQNATSVRADITAEKRYQGTSEERRKGQSGIRVATGRVAIVSDGPEVIVQAAPALAEKIAKRFDEFVADKAAGPIVFDVYASWSLSYVLGGVATSLCALYVGGATLAVLMFPFKMMRSMLGKSSATEQRKSNVV